MAELKEYVADMSLLCGTERYTMNEGKARGVNMVSIHNGKFRLTLKEDKCLDIFNAEYKGTNLAFVSKNGLVAPAIANNNTAGFLHSFDGGFLFTCGLDNIGKAANYNGRDIIQHGGVSVLPARNVRAYTGCENGKYFAAVSGEMEYTALFSSKLVLRRTVKMFYLEDSFYLTDELTNEAYADDEYMLLYHFNMGYPLIDGNAKMKIGGITETGYLDERAKVNVKEMFLFSPPTPARPEEVYSHKLDGGKITATLENKDMSLSLDFDSAALPYFTEWKSMASGDYALGFEPTTTPLSDRKHRKIAPGETHTFAFKVSVKG